jgi:ATP-dependent Zn protease
MDMDELAASTPSMTGADPVRKVSIIPRGRDRR